MDTDWSAVCVLLTYLIKAIRGPERKRKKGRVLQRGARPKDKLSRASNKRRKNRKVKHSR